jgi:hypothetical protein
MGFDSVHVLQNDKKVPSGASDDTAAMLSSSAALASHPCVAPYEVR